MFDRVRKLTESKGLQSEVWGKIKDGIINLNKENTLFGWKEYVGVD